MGKLILIPYHVDLAIANLLSGELSFSPHRFAAGREKKVASAFAAFKLTDAPRAGGSLRPPLADA